MDTQWSRRKDFLLRGLAIVGVIAGLCQHGLAQKRVAGLSAEKAAAARAWPGFFKAFRAAVNRRDRAALKEMMVRDFFFSGGGGDDNHDGDICDNAFKYWDDPLVHGWRAFDRALAKGAVPTRPEFGTDGEKHLSRVAPPSARSARNLDTAPPWIAHFLFLDGHWYCFSFSECCD